MKQLLVLFLSLSTSLTGRTQDSTRMLPSTWHVQAALSKPIDASKPLWTGRIAPVYSTDWYKSKLGAICRQELKWDQQLPVALRFRLGSVEACDKLEGKYGSAYGKRKLD